MNVVLVVMLVLLLLSVVIVEVLFALNVGQNGKMKTNLVLLSLLVLPFEY